MKKLATVVLVLLVGVVAQGCSGARSSISNTAIPSAARSNETSGTLYGQIESVEGNVYTLAMMADAGTDKMCPTTPGGKSQVGSTTGTANATGSGVAQPVPNADAVVTVNVQPTGESRQFTVGEATKLVDPSGNVLDLKNLTVGAIIQFTVESGSGEIRQAKLLTGSPSL